MSSSSFGFDKSTLPCVSEEILNDPTYSRKTVAIRNGRTLSYSECGNLESDHVVLFHMGIMGSSLATVMVHQQALTSDIRLISLDYPGTGESTLVKDRTLEDWAQDVEEFCDQILPPNQTIKLFGHCLGAPHVLAVWARMMDRVSHITLVAPWVGEPHTNPWWMRYFVQRLPMQTYLPGLGAPLLTSTTYLNYPFSFLVGGELRKIIRAMDEMQAYNRLQGSGGNKEMIRLALNSRSKEEFWDPILERIASKYKDKGEDAIPIQMYHGAKDTMVSSEACQLLVGWLAEAKCKVDCTLIDEADHNTILISPQNMATVLGPLGKKVDAAVADTKASS